METTMKGQKGVIGGTMGKERQFPLAVIPSSDTGQTSATLPFFFFPIDKVSGKAKKSSY